MNSSRYYSRVFLMIGFCLIMSALMFFSPEVRAEDNFGLRGGIFYTTLDPGEINDTIEDVQGWVEDMEEDLGSDLRREIEDEEDFDRVTTDVSEVPMHPDEIEWGRGFSAGLSYNIPDFAGKAIVMGERFTADSKMEGNIDGGIEIIEDNEVLYVIDLSGESENEVDLSLQGGYAGVQPELTDNLTLTLAAGYYWGEGEVYHRSTGSVDSDDEVLEDYYEHGEVEYTADLDFGGSLAGKLGLDYSYPVTANLNLRASGLMRILEMEVKRTQDLETDGDAGIIRDYYEDEFDFELPSSFDEDMGGFEAALGINVEF